MLRRKKQGTETLKDITKRVVNSLQGPTSVGEVRQQVLAIRPGTAKAINSAVRTYLNDEIGKSLIFLDKETIIPLALAFQGVRFRINIDEIPKKGRLASEEFQPFFAELNPETVQFVGKDGAPLGTGRIKVEKRMAQPIIWTDPAYLLLTKCFPQQEIQVGDSILVTVVQHQPQPVFCLEYETASHRREKDIQKKNQELADIVFDLLENARDEYIMVREAIPTAYCRLQDPRGYPGDSWKKVLETDDRMGSSGWQIAYPERHTWWDDFEFEDEVKREKGKGRKPKGAKLPPEEADKVYCWKASFSHNPGMWRCLELQGQDTLAEFDRSLREAFQHDLGDHLSGFWRKIPRGQTGRFREIEIAEIDPWGKGKGAERRLAELKLQEGNLLKYVYDFGDWVEHTLVLEAIAQPSPQEKYPRLTDQNKPRYKYCEHCRQKKSKAIAAWICIECSNVQQRMVLVCEDCLSQYHQEHYIKRMLY